MFPPLVVVVEELLLELLLLLLLVVLDEEPPDVNPCKSTSHDGKKNIDDKLIANAIINLNLFIVKKMIYVNNL